MIPKHLLRLLLIICIYATAGNSYSQLIKTTGEKKFGLNIKNGPRQGLQYFDSTKTENSYRYYTMTITNDSTIPIQLNIYFSQKEVGLNDRRKSKVFLLPRQLTPAATQFDKSISNELKKYLDMKSHTPEHFNKILKPEEKCVLTFGFLTNSNLWTYDPTNRFDPKLIVSKEKSSAQSIKLKISDTLIILCGQFSYINK